AAEAAHGGGGEDAFRRAADAHRGVDAGAADGGGDAGGEVAVGDQFDAGAGFADLRDEVVVALAVEDGDGQLVDVALEGFRETVQVLFDGGGEADEIGGGGADDDLVHVDVGSVEEAALLGRGDD